MDTSMHTSENPIPESGPIMMMIVVLSGVRFWDILLSFLI